MRAALAMALLAAGGLALAQAGGPGLRSVSTPAEPIESREGALLTAVEFDGPARLRWVRPATLRPVAPALRLEEEFVADFALSPDGGSMAVGTERQGRIELVDLDRWRTLGAIDLPGPSGHGAGGTSGLVWASPRRLLALSGPAHGAPARPVVVDPVRRRALDR